MSIRAQLGRFLERRRARRLRAGLAGMQRTHAPGRAQPVGGQGPGVGGGPVDAGFTS